MTFEDAQKQFQMEDSWSHGCFEEQCELHGIEATKGESFSQTAQRLWAALTNEERQAFVSEFSDYYGTQPLA